MPLYDYRCAAGHVTERRAGYHQSSVECPGCGGEAVRAEVNRVGVNGFAIPPMRERPLAVSQGLEALDEMQSSARKAGVAAPDVWGAAQAQAAEIRKHAPELITGT